MVNILYNFKEKRKCTGVYTLHLPLPALLCGHSAQKKNPKELNDTAPATALGEKPLWEAPSMICVSASIKEAVKADTRTKSDALTHYFLQHRETY